MLWHVFSLSGVHIFQFLGCNLFILNLFPFLFLFLFKQIIISSYTDLDTVSININQVKLLPEPQFYAGNVLTIQDSYNKPVSRTSIVISYKIIGIWVCLSCALHSAVHNQGGYNNSLILQTLELLPGFEKPYYLIWSNIRSSNFSYSETGYNHLS